jgi:lysyl-tRNA synthetase class 2
MVEGRRGPRRGGCRCSQAGAIAWKRTGPSVLELGDEAVVDTAGFTLAGRPIRNVRQAAARVERAGYG